VGAWPTLLVLNSWGTWGPAGGRGDVGGWRKGIFENVVPSPESQEADPGLSSLSLACQGHLLVAGPKDLHLQKPWMSSERGKRRRMNDWIASKMET
jgi:hypothetical protein